MQTLANKISIVLAALEDGRQLNFPKLGGKIAMTESGEIGHVMHRHYANETEDVILLGTATQITLNNFIKAIQVMSDDDFSILAANNALQKVKPR